MSKIELFGNLFRIFFSNWSARVSIVIDHPCEFCQHHLLSAGPYCPLPFYVKIEEKWKHFLKTFQISVNYTRYERSELQIAGDCRLWYNVYWVFVLTPMMRGDCCVISQIQAKYYAHLLMQQSVGDDILNSFIMSDTTSADLAHWWQRDKQTREAHHVIYQS